MKKNIKLLLLRSKKRGKLNVSRIRQIASQLPKSQLREYLLLLKQARQREKVVVEVPIDRSQVEQSTIVSLKKRFKGREIEFVKNKELIGGLRLSVDDNVLDLSFKGIFSEFI